MQLGWIKLKISVELLNIQSSRKGIEFRKNDIEEKPNRVRDHQRYCFILKISST